MIIKSKYIITQIDIFDTTAIAMNIPNCYALAINAIDCQQVVLIVTSS